MLNFQVSRNRLPWRCPAALPSPPVEPPHWPPYSAQYPKLWAISEQGPATPGLADDMVPQGLTYWKEKNWLITSNYMGSGGASTLMMVDAQTQAVVKRVNLYQTDGSAYTGHAGGVAVSGQHAWISSDGYACWIDLKELADAPDGAKVKFAGRFATPTRASFATYGDGILWVGEFYNLPSYPTDKSHAMINNEQTTYNAWVTGYRLDAKTDLLPEGSEPKSGDAVPDYLLSIPGNIQGMGVTGDSIILSQSFSRTKDGVLVVIHDPTVDRTTSGKGAVGEMTLAELKQLDAGSWMSPEFAGERIPTLAELVEAVPAPTRLFLEMKAGNDLYPGIEKEVAGFLHERDLVGRTNISSFDHFVLLRMSRLLPGIETGMLYSARPVNPVAMASACGATAIHTNWKYATAEMVAQAHHAGLKVNAWTPNSPAAVARCLSYGLDAIITDHPELARS